MLLELLLSRVRSSLLWRCLPALLSTVIIACLILNLLLLRRLCHWWTPCRFFIRARSLWLRHLHLGVAWGLVIPMLISCPWALGCFSIFLDQPLRYGWVSGPGTWWNNHSFPRCLLLLVCHLLLLELLLVLRYHLLLLLCVLKLWLSVWMALRRRKLPTRLGILLRFSCSSSFLLFNISSNFSWTKCRIPLRICRLLINHCLLLVLLDLTWSLTRRWLIRDCKMVTSWLSWVNILIWILLCYSCIMDTLSNCSVVVMVLVRWSNSLVFTSHFLFNSRWLGLRRHHNLLLLLTTTCLTMLLMLHVNQLAVVICTRNFQAIVLHIRLNHLLLRWGSVTWELLLHLRVTHINSVLLWFTLNVRLLDH
jgi:hypothetical protein